MPEHVCYEAFSLNIAGLEDINWFNFVYCLKFMSLKPDLSKEMKI